MRSKQELDDEANRMKQSINLVEFACHHGFVVNPRKSKEGIFWRLESGDEGGARLDVRKDAKSGDWVYYDWKNEGGGNIFTFYRTFGKNEGNGAMFAELREWLNSPPESTVKYESKPSRPVKTLSPAEIQAKWEGFKHYSGGYLESRGLKTSTIGLFYSAIRLAPAESDKLTKPLENVAFVHYMPAGVCGWELKNKGFTGFAEGCKKGFFNAEIGRYESGQPPKIILAESAIDAMSFFQESCFIGSYISFGGGMQPEQKEMLAALLKDRPQSQIIVATDNDAQGRKYFDFFKSVRPDAVYMPPPDGFKDWNDVCQSKMPQQRPAVRPSGGFAP